MKWACLAACVLAYGLIEASWAEDTQSQSQSQDRGQSKRAWLLKKFDANGDGKLDSQERETARKAKILKKFDANGDGTLDQTEKKPPGRLAKSSSKKMGISNRVERKCLINLMLMVMGNLGPKKRRLRKLQKRNVF